MSDGGFWAGAGEPSSVDWCEPNYVVTPYVAEWVNTVTSVPMILMGVYGVYMTLRHRPVVSRRFLACYAGLALVGAGSVAFHATLLRLPQAADELPMVYAILVATWVMLHRRTEPGKGKPSALFFLAYAVGFTVAYFVSASYFLIFLATFSVLASFVAASSAWITFHQATPPPMAGLAKGALWSFGLGMFACWLPEHVFLACDHPLQRAYLHGWWHLGSGLGVYLWICWAVADRLWVRGVQRAWRRGFVVPTETASSG